MLDITPDNFKILQEYIKQGEGASYTSVAKELKISKSAVAKHTRALRKSGYIEMRFQPAYCVHLTEKAKQLPTTL
jgi:Mn-dependent DtxR family transcriptional regulator